MGLIASVFAALFGSGRNVVRETAEVFRENAESGAVRGSTLQLAALAAQQAEFGNGRRGLFDRVMDGINRLPRPLMALGTMGLILSAMVDPVWFTARMAGLAVVPEPLWWLLGVVVSFYFGARHQAKGQAFQTSIAESMARMPQVVANIRQIEALRDDQGAAPAIPASENAALDEWRKSASGTPATL